jgi:hypothetical protein
MLDHIIPLIVEHLRRLGREYLAYYHDDRTHNRLAKQTPMQRCVEYRRRSKSKVIAFPRIGGLHHPYTWSAAA